MNRRTLLLAALALAVAVAGAMLWRRHAEPPAASLDRLNGPGPAPPAAAEPAGPQTAIRLRDVTAETGVRFVHTDGGSGNRYIVESVSAGLATFDYDNDGDIDLYFLNGAPLKGARYDTPPKNALYRNDGGWRFTDVTDEAGVGDTGFGLGVAVGDYDNDGDQDLYLNNYGPNVLYRNNGDGTFTNVTEAAGVACGNKVGAGACFLDIENDGDLDLYVANYVNFTYENHVTHSYNGYPLYAGPTDFEPVADVLYRNNGDGTFTDISRESGVGQAAGTGMGMVCADYDRDGDTDVFVLNDVAGNFFFRNDGRGRFEEVGLFIGAAVNGFGNELASMGVECGDYDNDGWLDFYMTSYEAELPVLYRNLGSGVLEDVTYATGAGAGCLPYVNWGVGIVDLDNDGDRDIYVANGHIQDLVDYYSDTSAYKAPNVLLMNLGPPQFTFVDVSAQAGDGLAVREASRGAAFDDLDNDGDVDIVVLNSRARPTILRNETASRGHWLQLRLEGTTCNRDAVGAQVLVEAGGLRLADEVHSGRGYQSHYGSRLYFGLGPHAKADRIEIRWPGGARQELRDVAADQRLRVRQPQ